jgi:hypothetical protein
MPIASVVVTAPRSNRASGVLLSRGDDLVPDPVSESRELVVDVLVHEPGVVCRGAAVGGTPLAGQRSESNLGSGGVDRYSFSLADPAAGTHELVVKFSRGENLS